MGMALSQQCGTTGTSRATVGICSQKVLVNQRQCSCGGHGSPPLPRGAEAAPGWGRRGAAISGSRPAPADAGAIGEGKCWNAAHFSASHAVPEFADGNLAVTSNQRSLCPLASHQGERSHSGRPWVWGASQTGLGAPVFASMDSLFPHRGPGPGLGPEGNSRFIS